MIKSYPPQPRGIFLCISAIKRDHYKIIVLVAEYKSLELYKISNSDFSVRVKIIMCQRLFFGQNEFSESNKVKTVNNTVMVYITAYFGDSLWFFCRSRGSSC